MGKIDEYLDKAKSLAEEAGDAAKAITGEVVSRAKDLSEDHSKVKELTQNAREQSVSFAMGVKEKAEGLFQDARAAKEIRRGISELAARRQARRRFRCRRDQKGHGQGAAFN